MRIVTSLQGDIVRILDWANQLAHLTKVSWTGKNGTCYFPYAPLTTSTYWETVVKDSWQKGSMISWVLVSDSGKILSHAACIKKDGYYELGRWVSYPDSPQGAMTNLCLAALGSDFLIGQKVLVETTQAHTSSQFICEKRLGLRFAGIGFLTVINGIPWDIIYYDNVDIEDFVPEQGKLGNPLNKPVFCLPEHRARLQEAAATLTGERCDDLPPKQFHVLPHRLDLVRDIFATNIDLSVEV